MSLRFSTLASSAFGFVLATGLAAGQPNPSPAPKVGFIRFWDMLPAANGSFEIRKLNASQSEPALLNATAYQYSRYTDVPAGRYQLAVFSKSHPQAAIRTFDVDLKPDIYLTLIVTPQNGSINVEVTDDTQDPRASAATLMLRNYFPGTTVSVSAGTKTIINNLVYGQSVKADFPLERVSLTLHTRLPDGKPAQAGAEMDFRSSNRATLLIIPDSYGRFRARVTSDGKNL